jgi:hypothetical protein
MFQTFVPDSLRGQDFGRSFSLSCRVMRLPHAALFASALLASACHNGYVNPPLSSTETPPNMTPTTLRVTTSSRNDQKIDVTATVLSTDGHYVPGVALTFAVDVGTITAAAAATDYTGAIHALASTPTATTLHVKGGGLATDASLPASVQQTPTDGLILNVAGIGTTGVAQQMFISSTAAGPWSWSFGDGATDQTVGLTTSHTYGRAGAFAITVTNGTLSTTARTTISDPPAPTPTPTPALSAALECTPGKATTDPVGCHVTMTGADGSALTSTITSIDWDWGDGQRDTAHAAPPAVLTHTYAVTGAYTVITTAHAPAGNATAQTSVKVP